jgi:hypothetical protein
VLLAHPFVGGERCQGEGLWGPTQGRRECETLYVIANIWGVLMGLEVLNSEK